MVSAIKAIVMVVSGGRINIPVNAAAHFLAFQDEIHLKFLAKKGCPFETACYTDNNIVVIGCFLL